MVRMKLNAMKVRNPAENFKNDSMGDCCCMPVLYNEIVVQRVHPNRPRCSNERSKRQCLLVCFLLDGGG